MVRRAFWLEAHLRSGDPAAKRIGDTDLEARHLFTYFRPGQSTVKFGRGSVTFHWSNRETVPTRLHFITNWNYADGQTHVIANTLGYSSKHVLLPIWNNFAPWPAALGALARAARFLPSCLPFLTSGCRRHFSDSEREAAGDEALSLFGRQPLVSRINRRKGGQ